MSKAPTRHRGRHRRRQGRKQGEVDDQKRAVEAPNLKRITRESLRLSAEPPPGVLAAVDEDNYRYFHIQLNGAKGTPYEGQLHRLELFLPEAYPLEPPKVRFATKIDHPYIDQVGRIHVDILKDAWSPALQISTVILSIQALLSAPESSGPMAATPLSVFDEEELDPDFGLSISRSEYEAENLMREDHDLLLGLTLSRRQFELERHDHEEQEEIRSSASSSHEEPSALKALPAALPAARPPASDGKLADVLPSDGSLADGLLPDGSLTDSSPADGQTFSAASVGLLADDTPADDLPTDGRRAAAAPADSLADVRRATPQRSVAAVARTRRKAAAALVEVKSPTVMFVSQDSEVGVTKSNAAPAKALTRNNSVFCGLLTIPWFVLALLTLLYCSSEDLSLTMRQRHTNESMPSRTMLLNHAKTWDAIVFPIVKIRQAHDRTAVVSKTTFDVPRCSGCVLPLPFDHNRSTLQVSRRACPVDCHLQVGQGWIRQTRPHINIVDNASTAVLPFNVGDQSSNKIVLITSLQQEIPGKWVPFKACHVKFTYRDGKDFANRCSRHLSYDPFSEYELHRRWRAMWVSAGMLFYLNHTKQCAATVWGAQVSCGSSTSKEVSQDSCSSVLIAAALVCMMLIIVFAFGTALHFTFIASVSLLVGVGVGCIAGMKDWRTVFAIAFGIVAALLTVNAQGSDNYGFVQFVGLFALKIFTLISLLHFAMDSYIKRGKPTPRMSMETSQTNAAPGDSEGPGAAMPPTVDVTTPNDDGMHSHRVGGGMARASRIRKRLMQINHMQAELDNNPFAELRKEQWEKLKRKQALQGELTNLLTAKSSTTKNTNKENVSSTTAPLRQKRFLSVKKALFLVVAFLAVATLVTAQLVNPSAGRRNAFLPAQKVEILEEVNDRPVHGNDMSHSNATKATCSYENDGVCDVPTYCLAGTDVADCAAGDSRPTFLINDTNVTLNIGDWQISVDRCIQKGFALPALHIQGKSLSVYWITLPRPFLPSEAQLGNMTQEQKTERKLFWLLAFVFTYMVTLCLGTLILTFPKSDTSYSSLDDRSSVEPGIQPSRGMVLGMFCANFALDLGVTLWSMQHGSLSKKFGLDWELYWCCFLANCTWMLAQAVVCRMHLPANRKYEFTAFALATLGGLMPFLSDTFDTLKDVMFGGLCIESNSLLLNRLGYASLLWVLGIHFHFACLDHAQAELQAAYVSVIAAPTKPDPENRGIDWTTEETSNSSGGFRIKVLAILYKQTTSGKRQILIEENAPQAVGALIYSKLEGGSLLVVYFSLLLPFLQLAFACAAHPILSGMLAPWFVEQLKEAVTDANEVKKKAMLGEITSDQELARDVIGRIAAQGDNEVTKQVILDLSDTEFQKQVIWELNDTELTKQIVRELRNELKQPIILEMRDAERQKQVILDLNDTELTKQVVRELRNELKQPIILEMRDAERQKQLILDLSDTEFQKQVILELPKELKKPIISDLAKERQWTSFETKLIEPYGLGREDLDDDFIQELAAHCKQLEQIFLAFTEVTDAGLKEIAQHCQHLTEIDLWGTKVTDAGVKEFNGKLPNCRIIR